MGSRNSNSVNQKKRRGRKRKKALIIFAVIAAVAGMLFGVTYKVFEADTIEFVGSTHYSDEELKKYNAYAMGPDKKVIYLTFDEGTMTSYLPQIVEVLNNNNVKGTFFLCKNYIKNNKELINKMLDSGHSIGNHTASHLSMPSLASKENFSKYLEEIISVEDTFKEVTGREMDKIYREPRGEFSKRSLNIMKDLGYSTYFWSSAYKDWDDKLTKEEALTSMIERVHNGAIFLLHPTSKGNYLALENFIKTMKEKGYTFDLVKNI